jgi:phosphopantothenate---cysteine ligase (ATP)
MSLEEAIAAADAFLAENIHADSIAQPHVVATTVGAFVRRWQAAAPSQRFAVVTSGGTVAPLERQHIRHVTNCATGLRGSVSAEVLLRKGFKVIFLHKTGSILPFARHFQDGKFLSEVTPGQDDTVVLPRRLYTACVEQAQYADSIVYVPFHTVAEYMVALKGTLEACRDAMGKEGVKRVLVYLVAAVADFYVPYSLLPAEKIESRPDDPEMTIYMHKVPKALARGLVGQVWGPGAFVVTFKLETDASRVTEKVLRHINYFSNIKVVVANLLQTCRVAVTLYDVRKPDQPMEFRLPDAQQQMDGATDVTLEGMFLEKVVALHAEYIDGSW